MATDKLINQSQGDDIISALDDIATGVGNISYGEQTSSDKVVAMTGYQKESTAAAISPGDSLNVAIGKLEKKVDDNTTNKVAGPSSTVVDENIVLFDGSDGKTVKSSGVAISKSTDQYPVMDDDAHIPTTKVVKRYVDETATGISRYLGTITSVSDLDTDAKKGDFYIAAAAWGDVHVCDEIIAEKDGPSKSIDGTNWRLLHNEAIPIVNTWTDPVNTTTPSTLLVDTRLDTAENNILETKLWTRKNILLINTWRNINPQYVSFTTHSDGSLTITKTAAPWNCNISAVLDVKAGTYVLRTGTDNNAFVFFLKDSTSTTTYGTSAQSSFTINSNITGANLYLSIDKDYTGIITIYPFLYEKELYDVSPSYEAPSLSNSSLTSGLIDTMNNGAKNKIYNESTSITANNLVFTANNDGTVKVTGSISSSETRQAYGYVNSYTPSVGDYLWGCPTGGSSSKYELMFYVNDNNVAHDYGNGVDLSPYAGMTGEILIIIRPDQSNLNLLFQPMLSTKAVHDVSPAYVPYALSNPVITPALIEQVDNGAKNLLDWKNTTYYAFPGANNHATYVKTDTNVTVTSTGTFGFVAFNMPDLPADTYVLSCTVSNMTTASDIVQIATQVASPANIVAYSGNSRMYLAFTLPASTTQKIMLYANYSNEDVSNTVTFSDLMICTLADWNISHKYEPYALPNSALTSPLIDVVNSNSKNLLPNMGSTETISVITYTHNADGSVLVNGSGTHNTQFHTIYSGNLYLEAGTYVFSGCPAGGSGSSYEIRLLNGNTQQFVECKGTPVEFTMATAGYVKNILIRIDSTYNPSNLTFYPMIVEKSLYDFDNSYQPYIATDLNLTRAGKSIVDNGVKNLLNVLDIDYIKSINPGTWDGNTFTAGEVKFTFNGDGTVTVNTTATTTAARSCMLAINLSGNDINGLMVSGSTPTTSITVQKQESNWNTYAESSEGYADRISGAPVAATTRIVLAVIANKTVSNEVMKPMLCTEEQYRLSPFYQPYALSNPVITPALIEQVDSGAKNILRYVDEVWNVNLQRIKDINPATGGYSWNGNAVTHNGVTFTINQNGTVSTSGTTPSGESAYFTLVDYGAIPTSAYADKVLSGCPTGGNYSTGYSLYVVKADGNTLNADEGNSVVISNAAPIRYIRIIARANTNMNGKVFYPMICTKAAFAVSQKYVPYRPPYDDLEAKPHQIEITSESDLDNLPAGTVTGNLVSMIAGVQAGQWVTVRTIDLNTSSGTNRRRMQVMIAAGGLVASRLYHNSAWLQWYFGHNDATKIFERTTSGNETITNISPYGSFQLIAYDTTNKDAFSASFPRSSLSGNLKLSVTGANGAVLGTILRSGSTTTYACTVANGYTLVLFGY